MSLKTAINIAMIFGAMVCGGVFVKLASEGHGVSGLLAGVLIGIVSGIMALGVLTAFLNKNDKAAVIANGQQQLPLNAAPPIPASTAQQTEKAMKGSSRDQWYLQQMEILLAPLAQAMQEDVKPLALDLLQKTKAEATARHGNNIYTETLGDQIIDKQSAMLSKRLAAGLTTDDVRSYWNQPMLMQLLQVKVRELVNFITVDVAQQSGSDPAEAVRAQRKTQPQYGDPDAWSAAHLVNKGFTADDADIYPEFAPRIGRWESNVTAPVRAQLIAKHSSYNAMVRSLIRQGLL